MSELRDFARELAVQAGLILKDGFESAHEFHIKEGEHNFATEMDLASEALILKAIRGRYPDHSILAEESGASAQANSRYRWVVDPLDGTTNYAHRVPLYCVSIGLEHDGEPVMGVIYAPMTGELYEAEKGAGAFLNGKPLKVSRAASLNQALLVTGFPYDPQVKVDNLQFFSKFTLATQGVRRLGSAALDLAWVAAGRFDAFWEPRLSPWDVAAGVVLVREAGGRVTAFDGSVHSCYGDEILASNGLVHDEMVALLKRSEA